MKISRMWIVLCLAGIVAGCGQKGPLVHPDTPKHKKVAPTPRTAPAPSTPAPSAPDATPKP